MQDILGVTMCHICAAKHHVSLVLNDATVDPDVLMKLHRSGAACSAVFHLSPGDVVHVDVIIKHISVFHSSVVFGQFD